MADSDRITGNHESLANLNRRVLVIDDNQAIHEDFRKVLCSAVDGQEALDMLEAQLLGGGRSSAAPHFDIESAMQGEEGVRKAELALAAGRPYSLAFCAMLRPPGWAGLKTYEFLGKAESWTRVWTATERPCISLNVYPLGVRGLAALAVDLVAKGDKKWQRKQ